MIYKKTETIIYWVLQAFAVVLPFIFLINKDIFWSLFFILISGVLLFFSLRLKQKLFYLLVSLFIFLHFLVFPYLYVITLTKDPYSFQIQENVTINEQKEALTDINDEFASNKLKDNIKFIDSIIESHDVKLDSTLQRIINKNSIFSGDFIVYKSSNRRNGGAPMPDEWIIVINKICGDYVCEFKLDKYESKNTLKDVLLKEKTIMESNLTQFKNVKEKIDNNKIWTYKRILWYSINVIETKNIMPISKTANVLFFFHKFIIAGFIILPKIRTAQ